MLMWAREHHCPWDEGMCAFAAERGYLEVLMWAREHVCPWDSRTCAQAAEGGHLEVLMWAQEHGAPVHPAHAQWYEHLLRGEPHAMDHHRTFEV